jgi:hypothetical protein
MKDRFEKLVEDGRVRTGGYATKPGERMGAFKVRCPLTSTWLQIIISDGTDWQEMGLPFPAWEHVSVSNQQRCPTWEEMCWVKDLFWAPEECVMQYHPPQSKYVNKHDRCLHLWRPIGLEMPMPPIETV